MTEERSKAGVAATPKQVDHLVAFGLDRESAGRFTRGEASVALGALRREGRGSTSPNNAAGAVIHHEGEAEAWRILLGGRAG